VDASADQLELGMVTALTPVDELELSVGVTRLTSNLTTLGEPSATTAEAQALGSYQTLRATFAEVYEHAFSEASFLEQTAVAALTTPLFEDEVAQTATLLAGLSLGPAWLIDNHRISLLAGAEHMRAFPRDEPDGTRVEAVDQTTPSAIARWRYSMTESWSTELSGGIAVPFNPQGDVAPAPLAGAGIYFQREDYFASLAYARTTMTSLATGRSYDSDTGTLSGFVPLWPEGGLSLQTSVGVAHNRLVEASLDGQSVTVNNWVADAGLRWALPEVVPLSAQLRYQRLQQFDSPDNHAQIFDFTRNVASLTIGYFIPPRDRRRPPARRTPQR
jgi:hypothetical protein